MTLHDPNVTLKQMRDYAQEAIELSAGRTREDLEIDRLFQLAMVRLVEVIGEAATRLPEEVRAAYPDVPWRLIIGTRNRLIHGYDRVHLDTIWSILQNNLRSLVVELGRIIDERT